MAEIMIVKPGVLNAADKAALRKALEDIRSRSSINLAMRSDQFELTAMLGDIYQIADAALATQPQEPTT